ncbi:MAG: hypothetical protein SNI57_02135, partial [Rikenellaceae bacterium]
HPYQLLGGYSLLRYYTLSSIKPLTCTVLYVARTFLSCSLPPKGSGAAAIERVRSGKDSNKLLKNLLVDQL